VKDIVTPLAEKDAFFLKDFNYSKRIVVEDTTLYYKNIFGFLQVALRCLWLCKKTHRPLALEMSCASEIKGKVVISI
jgi:hypothetical protein